MKTEKLGKGSVCAAGQTFNWEAVDTLGGARVLLLGGRLYIATTGNREFDQLAAQDAAERLATQAVASSLRPELSYRRA